MYVTKRLQFSRMAALVVVFCMGTSGAYALISSQAASHKGAIKITTYAWDGSQAVPIGNVNVSVAAVGGPQNCDSNAGTTNAAGDNSVTLGGCDVANNGGPKTYRLVSASRDGYSFRSLHVFNGGMSIGPDNSFPVQKNNTTSLGVYMDPPPTFNPPAPAPESAPPSTPATKYKGKVKVTTYAFVSPSEQVGIGNVKITVSAVGGPEKCDSNTGTTNAAGDNSVTLSGCEVADDGGPKTYEVKAEREGYATQSVRLVEGTSKTVLNDARFKIKKDDTTTIHVWMNPPANFNPPAPSGGGSPSQPSGGSGGGSDNKNGFAEVTTRVFQSDSSQPRQGNVKVRINSVNVDNGNKALTCDDTEKTTDSNGGSEGANKNYGQANFVNCFTGSEGKKQYEISYLEAPAGYIFRSIRITNGSFVSGAKNSQNLHERFNILAGESNKVAVDIWLTKLEAAPSLSSLVNNAKTPEVAAQIAAVIASLPPNAGGGAVHQVITQSGTIYVPAKNNEASQALATLLNSMINSNQLDPAFVKPAVSDGEPQDDPLTEDAGDADATDSADADEGPPSPPSTPSNLKASQDAAGAIILSWDASAGNPAGETVSYSIERLAIEGKDQGDSGDVDTPGWKDESEDLKYPQEYTYRVYAKDDEDNISEPATVTYTTAKPQVNVQPAADGANPSADQQPAGNDGTKIPSTDNPAVSVTFPANASAQPMACATNNANVDETMNQGMGQTVVGVQGTQCRTADGEPVEEFQEEAEYEVELDENYDEEEGSLYAYDGTDWTEVSTSEDGESSPDGSTVEYSGAKLVKGKKGQKAKYAVKSKKPMKLAVMKKQEQSSKNIAPWIILPSVLLLGTGVAIILYRKQLLFGSAATQYPNGDYDLLLLPKRPDTDPTQITEDPALFTPDSSNIQAQAADPIAGQEQPVLAVPAEQPVDEATQASAEKAAAVAEHAASLVYDPSDLKSNTAIGDKDIIDEMAKAPKLTGEVQLHDTFDYAGGETEAATQQPAEISESKPEKTVIISEQDLPMNYSGLKPEQIIRPTNPPIDETVNNSEGNDKS